MALYVVSFPPVMVNSPGGSSTMVCLRDRSRVFASAGGWSWSWRSNGRSPAQEATTSRPVTAGKYRATAETM